ncbi:MAG: anthranilate synthase component I family protein [Flavobacteriaceae bacterium]
MRTRHLNKVKDIELFKKQLLFWSQQFNDVVWLDSNNHNQKFSTYDAVLAIDAFTSIQTDFHGAFDDLKEYQSITNDWIFGYLSYDLKNDIENLESNNFDGLQFPDLYFFQPKKLFLIKDNVVETLYLKVVGDELKGDIKAIRHCEKLRRGNLLNDIKIKLRIHKDEYFEKIDKMQSHIHRGDIYEANFCQEFYAEETTINPVETYQKLNNISNPPFATYLKCNDKYVLSASLERYIKKEGNIVISQPIKGTARRSKDLDEDKQLKQDLQANEKERSENIMIVDLVRNDLSRLAIKGTVNVEELCKVYTFKQVHQMISTIVSEVEDVNPVDIIKATFPMGSMTGAPKISAMKIIENLEETKRGVYSGAVGYFSPKGDFDFNVVIRSILYNETQKYVSYSVGGAITSKSDPLKEYEECLVKAKAMREVLES